MSNEAVAMRKEFLLKQIENEINAGFVFVEAARRAYKCKRANEVEGALSKAMEAHKQISRQVSESALTQVKAITHHLGELREAIEWLQETIK